ncbi:MAG: hypothetical protein R2851_18130 [Caldilineaceae bacterium]
MLGTMLVLATILSFLLIGVASSAGKRRRHVGHDPLHRRLRGGAHHHHDLNRPQQGVISVGQTMADLLRTITPPGQ